MHFQHLAIGNARVPGQFRCMVYMADVPREYKQKVGKAVEVLYNEWRHVFAGLLHVYTYTLGAAAYAAGHMAGR